MYYDGAYLLRTRAQHKGGLCNFPLEGLPYYFGTFDSTYFSQIMTTVHYSIYYTIQFIISVNIPVLDTLFDISGNWLSLLLLHRST